MQRKSFLDLHDDWAAREERIKRHAFRAFVEGIFWGVWIGAGIYWIIDQLI